MEQEMLKRLDVLAEKLGVAASMVWGFYIRQAYIDGVADLAAAGMITLVFIVAVRKAPWLAAFSNSNKEVIRVCLRSYFCYPCL